MHSVKIERAFQRMLGTLIGAGIVWFIVLDDPNPWLIISAIALLQFATEVVIGYNYALG